MITRMAIVVGVVAVLALDRQFNWMITDAITERDGWLVGHRIKCAAGLNY